MPQLFPQYSRSQFHRLIKSGAVTVNGNVPRAKDQVRQGDLIQVTEPAPVHLDLQPEDIPLDIVYEDDDVLVVNKPQGMVVHPAPGHPDHTLVNALLYHCPLSTINGTYRSGIVHRIDKDTSGLLMVAKTDRAHRSLAAQLKLKPTSANTRRSFTATSGRTTGQSTPHLAGTRKTGSNRRLFPEAGRR